MSGEMVVEGVKMDEDGDNTMTVAFQAYQVIGALAYHANLFEHPEVQRALDYFSEVADGENSPREDFLPWSVPAPRGQR